MDSIFKMAMLFQVVDQVSGPAARIGRSLAGLKKKANDLAPAFEKFRNYGMVAGAAGAGIAAGLTSTVLATVGTQRALGELSSVGIRDLGALEKAGQAFSSSWAGTTKAEFISAAYDIKSGISSLTDTGVAEFTRLAALTGKATKSTTAEMTSLFATGYGIYKEMYGDLSDLQFGEVFSAGIAASVKAFKTTGSGMAQAISTLGATATTAKRPLEEQLAVLGMLQATMTGGEAGTKYKAIMLSAAAAGNKLGLSFVDSNNQLLSMPAILQKLRGSFGETLDAAEKMQIQKAFGTQEAVAVIDLLYGKVGELTNNISGLSGAMKQGSASTAQMAGTMNRDIGAGIRLLGQRWHNLVEVMGKQFLPVVVPVFRWIGSLMQRVSAFAGEHESLTRIVVLGVAALAGLLAVGGGLAAMFGAIGMAAPSVIGGFGLVSGAAGWLKTQLFTVVGAAKAWIVTQYRSVAASIAAAGGIKTYALSMATSLLSSIGAAITAVWGFTAALLANPITWIVVGVVALGAAIYLLYSRFEGVRKVVDAVGRVFVGLWSIIVSVGKAVWDALCNPLAFVKGLFHDAGNAVSGMMERFGSITPILKGIGKMLLSFMFPPLLIAFNWDKVKAGVTALVAWVRGVGPKLLGVAKTTFSAIGKGLLWAAMNLTPAGILAQAFNKVFTYLTGINLFESGKKIFLTLVNGIKSVINKPAEIVKKGLSFVKNLLPFSDAKEGPLSTLTLSGKKIMETLGSGVAAGAQGLKTAVDSAMAPVAAGIAGAAIALSPIAPPEIAGAGVPVVQPEIADAGVGAGPRACPVVQPEMPIVQPEIPVVQPDVPIVQPEIADAGVGAGPRACPVVQPEMPIVQPNIPVVQPDVPIVQPEIPVVQPDVPIVQPEIPVVQPDVPGVQQGNHGGLPLPSHPPKGVATPGVPNTATREASPQPKSKPVTIQNLTVNLSGVKDAEGFISQLQLIVEQLDG